MKFIKITNKRKIGTITLQLFISNLIWTFQAVLKSFSGKYHMMRYKKFKNVVLIIIYYYFVSNFDCLHASPLGHDLVSKVLWNQLFEPQADKPKSTQFRYNETIYCPSDSDRIITY